jgi:sulfur-carrier protein
LRKGRFDALKIEVPAATTVEGLIDRIGLPHKEVTLIFIGGKHADFSQTLVEGDTVALFPPVGGG